MTTRLRTIWPLLAGTMFVLILLYVLSVGPVCKYLHDGCFTNWSYNGKGRCDRLYRPIIWACDGSETFDSLIARYQGWWLGEPVVTRKVRKRNDRWLEALNNDEHYGLFKLTKTSSGTP